MERFKVWINGDDLKAGLILRENRPICIRVEPIDKGLPLAELTLRVGGLPLVGGGIPPTRPGGVEWDYTPTSVAGLLPLSVGGGGSEERFYVPVEPAKLTVAEYQFLLQDLRQAVYGIIYAIYGPTHRSLQRHPPSPDPVQRLLERFAFLEEKDVVPKVLRRVGSLEHHAIILAETSLMRRERVRRVPVGALHAIARRPEARYAPAIRKQVSPNSYENQVVKLLLLTLRRLTRTLVLEAKQLAGVRAEGQKVAGALLLRLQQIEAAGSNWARQVEQQLLQEPWPLVGVARAVDRPSTIFVMDPAYRELLGWYRLLQDVWEATVDSPAFTLPLRDLPTLYEIWCYVQVVAALQQGLGAPGAEQGLVRYREGGFEFNLKRGGESRILFRAGLKRVTVHYNKLYHGFTGLNYYPDITLEVEGPDGPEGLIVLDAKYRLNAEDECTTYKQDDIDKMHTYRDAIHWRGGRVESAFILYPGSKYDCWPEGVGDIGAAPLRPGPDGQRVELQRALALCLGRFGIAWKGEV